MADGYGVTCVKVKSKQKLLVGMSNGFVFEFDYLMSIYERGRMYRRYRNAVLGSVRDIDCHPTKEMFASVGLGRYLTVHRFNRPHFPLLQLYLKQRLTSVLFSKQFETHFDPSIQDKPHADDNNENNGDGDDNNNNNNNNDDGDNTNNGDDENDQFWNDIPTVDDIADNVEASDTRAGNVQGDDDVENFLSDGSDNEDEKEDHTLENALGQNWKEMLDGYNSDELQELLHTLEKENEKLEDSDETLEPPTKKRRTE
ncbi:WD40 repeat-containing protein [Reticulomyxa filosa]|uniref:WD40 repeat-containing protein n=1 Tax=Reticulomyxa filosa TaxID=46433 RepID=X6M039_RETFI|nr:WD40 repeat-containing protein [Reticulomyxa filosa]|eukprot:ETO06350.1 WD40 repeat-containing protein [Reticulomyxa filosa]